MGWTFKTLQDKVVELTNYEDEHDPENNIFFIDGLGYNNCDQNQTHPETGDILMRISVGEANRLRGVGIPEFGIKGSAPSKDLEMKNRQRKALEKNPMHTTMNDYKLGTPGSVPERGRSITRRRLDKKGVNIKKR